jgi:hypothetical protein
LNGIRWTPFDGKPAVMAAELAATVDAIASGRWNEDADVADRARAVGERVHLPFPLQHQIFHRIEYTKIYGN